MKNINWKVRFNNKQFILQLIASVFGPVMMYLGLSFEDLTTWQALGDMLVKAIQNPYVLGMTALSVWGTVTDPTTKGLKDSLQALDYHKPKE